MERKNKKGYEMIGSLKERFTALVLDTETHFKSEHQKLIYHIGWVMGDVRSPTSPRVKREFFIREFLPLDYWKHSYVDKVSKKRKFWKLDSRGDGVQRCALDNPKLVKSWDYVMKKLAFDVAQCHGIGSYNWAFDSSAIDITNRKLNHSGIISTIDTPPFCLLDCYATKIINKDYFRFIDKLDATELENYKSKSGKNLGYSAEIMARYMMQHHDYVEAHTALDDALVEFELAEYFLDKHYREFKKKFLGNPRFVSWIKIRDRISAKDKSAQRKLL